MFDIFKHQNDDAFMAIEPSYQNLIFILEANILPNSKFKWFTDEETGELIIEGTYKDLNEFICTELDNGEFTEEEIQNFADSIGFC